MVLITNTHEKKQGKEERGGERESERKREKEEVSAGGGYCGRRRTPVVFGDRRIAEKLRSEILSFFSIFQIKDGCFSINSINFFGF